MIFRFLGFDIAIVRTPIARDRYPEDTELRTSAANVFDWLAVNGRAASGAANRAGLQRVADELNGVSVGHAALCALMVRNSMKGHHGHA